MIDVARLDDFMSRFCGYGTWTAPAWFVGMEEGGGQALDEIERRLAAWDGSDELADLHEYQAGIGGLRWFSDRPKIRSTWGKLIRVLLAFRGARTDKDSVRQYQRDQLGRRNADTALIELLPLPSPSTAKWIYSSLNIPAIATRERYYSELLPRRIAAIHTRIATHRPAFVVFYGIGYREDWEAIIGTKFELVQEERFQIAPDAATKFVLAPHPVATGVSNADFEAIGRWLRQA